MGAISYGDGPNFTLARRPAPFPIIAVRAYELLCYTRDSEYVLGRQRLEYHGT